MGAKLTWVRAKYLSRQIVYGNNKENIYFLAVYDIFCHSGMNIRYITKVYSNIPYYIYITGLNNLRNQILPGIPNPLRESGESLKLIYSKSNV